MNKTRITKVLLGLLLMCIVLAVSNVLCFDKIRDMKMMMCNDSNTIAELSYEVDVLQDKLSVYTSDYTIPNNPPPRYLDVALDEDTQSYIYSLCCNYDIEEHYELIYAVIKTESNFDPSVVSSTNDYGLMQINKVNHSHLSKTLGVTDFLDPHQNIHCGVYLLSTLLHKYSVADALMAYNMGEGGASNLWKRGIHTTQYTVKVLANYKEYI